MSSFRVWLFRGLVAVAAGLMVTSAIMPWWTCTFWHGSLGKLPGALNIYQWGLRHNLEELEPYVAGDITPFYQTVLAWIFMATSVGLILYSTWLKRRKGKWLLGGIGLIYIAYAAIALVWIAIRTGDFNPPISMQGWSYTIRNMDVYTRLRLGYYLAPAAGLTCIALALLRDKIVGKPKLKA